VNTVRDRKLQGQPQGSAIVWILIWLCGSAGIAWAGYTYAIPHYEQKIQAAVSDSIASQVDLPVIVAAKGSVVTLSGQTNSLDSLMDIVNAAANTPGVRGVNTNLSIVNPDQSTQTAPDELVQISQLDGSESAQTTGGEETASSTLDNLKESSEAAETEATEAADLPIMPDRQETRKAAPVTVNKPTPLERPTFKLRISEEILVVEGKMSNGDDTDQLIQNAMTVFDVDVVSNGLIRSDQVANALWLTSIGQILPLMRSLDEPQISVLDKQITIAGAAPDRNVHDFVIGEALNSLGDFSLVEQVSIDSVPVKTDTLVADAADVINDSESAKPDSASLVTELNLPSSDNQPRAITAEQLESDDAAEDKSASDSVVPAPLEPIADTRTVGDLAAENETGSAADNDIKAEAMELGATAGQRETDTLVAPEIAIETVVETSVEPKAIAEPVTETPVEPDTTADAEISVKPEAIAESVTETPVEPDATADAEISVQPEAIAESVTETPVEPDATADAEISVKPEAIAESVTETPVEPEPPAVLAVETPSITDATTAESGAIMLSGELGVDASSGAGADVSADDAEPTVEAEILKRPEETAIVATTPSAENTDDTVDSGSELSLGSDSDTAAQTEDTAGSASVVQPTGSVESEASNGSVTQPEDSETTAEQMPAVVAEVPTEIADPVQQMPDDDLRSALSELPTLRILFKTDVNVLTQKSQDVLDQIASVLLRFPETNVAIEGHTDSTGASELNLRLSLLRATTVRDYLIDKGVSVYNLRALGFGEEVPIADNQTAEGRAINRRIEFTF